jgi:glutamyl-tRNA synthetase
LEEIHDWNVENLKQFLINYNKENWLKNGQTLWPIRAILSGVEASPGAFELMDILGKEETINRLKKALE